MNRRTRRAILWTVLAIALSILYRQLKMAGWSTHPMLIVFGALAIISSLGGFFLNSDPKYSEIWRSDY